MPYWAVKPTGREDAIRLERAETPLEAIRLAFGDPGYRAGTPFAKYNVGRWLVKNLGTRVAVIHSDRQRMALLTDPQGWVDPYLPKET